MPAMSKTCSSLGCSNLFGMPLTGVLKTEFRTLDLFVEPKPRLFSRLRFSSFSNPPNVSRSCCFCSGESFLELRIPNSSEPRFSRFSWSEGWSSSEILSARSARAFITPTGKLFSEAWSRSSCRSPVSGRSGRLAADNL